MGIRNYSVSAQAGDTRVILLLSMYYVVERCYSTSLIVPPMVARSRCQFALNNHATELTWRPARQTKGGWLYVDSLEYVVIGSLDPCL